MDSSKVKVSVQKIESVNTALNEIKKYNHALIYKISEALLIGKEEIQTISDFDEFVDARFFSETGELHLYNDGDLSNTEDIRIIEILENDSDDGKEFDYVDAKYNKRGSGQITVREYLSFDEDGQCVVEMTRLVGID